MKIDFPLDLKFDGFVVSGSDRDNTWHLGMCVVGLVWLSAFFFVRIDKRSFLSPHFRNSSNWWPIFVVAFYIASPIPYVISRKCMSDSYGNQSGRCWEACLFLTSIIVISAYGLPFVLAHTPLDKSVIQWGSAGYIFAGNTVIFATILVFICLMESESSYSYAGW